MPDIYWLIAAQRRFLEAMPPALAVAVRGAILATISERLAATFSEAHVVIVRNRLHGYRNRSDRHIFSGGGDPSSQDADHGCGWRRS